jgi:hypothetical protein
MKGRHPGGVGAVSLLKYATCTSRHSFHLRLLSSGELFQKKYCKVLIWFASGVRMHGLLERIPPAHIFTVVAEAAVAAADCEAVGFCRAPIGFAVRSTTSHNCFHFRPAQFSSDISEAQFF